MTDAPNVIWVSNLTSDTLGCVVLDDCEMPDRSQGDLPYIHADAPELVALREAAVAVERDFTAGSEWESMALSRLYDALAAFDALVKG